ncbi:MAG TPA: phosphate signaling complex protein PhoU [Chloroflexia bacterium]|nr:phosphate signaling complex protein PhoU [Chloroflexia bacterium]
MTRENFQEHLREVNDSVLVMGSMVDQAIERAARVLRDQDTRLARRVIEDDALINQIRFDIEDKCLLLIATQAPMATDLRMLAAALNIITDLERMADHAAGIAKIALLTAGEPTLKPLGDIPLMAEVAREMLGGSLRAFVERDPVTAQGVALRDDEVDALYNKVYLDLLGIMMADPRTIDRATHLLWAAHNLERIADRVTNVCERVLFLVTGRMIEIQSGTDRELEAEVPPTRRDKS